MSREYRDFNRLDPRLFKAFLAAAHSENFTVAAKNASMTQSGISQQIAKLEDQVGVPLFKRVNKTVLLTEPGKKLVLYIDQYLDGMDELFESISDHRQSLVGRVSYAMPGSCLLSPHLGLMLEKNKKHSGLDLQITIAANDIVKEKLLRGEIDFGFMTRKIPAPALHYTPYCKEEFILAAGKELAFQLRSEDDITRLPFVTYPGCETVFESWKKIKLPTSSRVTFESLPVAAEINQLDGVVTLVKGNVGVSVLPKHCVEEALINNSIVELEHIGKKKGVENQIFIVRLANLEPSRRTKQVIDWFHQILSK